MRWEEGEEKEKERTKCQSGAPPCDLASGQSIAGVVLDRVAERRRRVGLSRQLASMETCISV